MQSNSYFIGTSAGNSAIALHFRRLAEVLMEKGHQVTLLVDGQREDMVNATANPAVFTWPSRRPTRLKDALFLHQLIKERRPDCLIANFGSVNVMMIVGKLSGVPCRVAWYHTLSRQIESDWQGSAVHSALLRMRKQVVYDLSTHIVANAEATARDVQTVFNVPLSKCRMFPNALADPLADINLPPARDLQRIVCVGRLYPSKGQDVLIQALAQLCSRFPQIHLELIGDGPKHEAYHQLTRELGIEAHCTFAGARGRQDVFNAMARALVTVVPSRSEAFGLVNIEAMAVGTPVVASAVGGIVDIVRDGVDGFLVPPDDPDALADRLARFLVDPDLARKMGMNARQRFLECFEQKQVVSEQADWFEEILN